MFFGLFFGDWTLLIVLPGFLLALFAQIHVNSTYRRYAELPLYGGMTGAAVARRILDSNGLYDVRIERVGGHLSDHYDPRERVLRLSDTTYDAANVAAVGVAAHEAGHALQHGRGYAPLYIRMAILPVCRIGSNLAMPLFFIGLIVTYLSETVGVWLMLAGILAFALSVLFQLVTLPVEFNASRRAMRCLAGSGTMNDTQLAGARRVLSAAALTYVASLAVGLLSLLRLLLIAGAFGGRRR